MLPFSAIHCFLLLELLTSLFNQLCPLNHSNTKQQIIEDQLTWFFEQKTFFGQKTFVKATESPRQRIQMGCLPWDCMNKAGMGFSRPSVRQWTFIQTTWYKSPFAWTFTLLNFWSSISHPIPPMVTQMVSIYQKWLLICVQIHFCLLSSKHQNTGAVLDLRRTTCSTVLPLYITLKWLILFLSVPLLN